MPEGIICDVYMSGINIVDDPHEVDAGRTGRLPHPFGKAVLVAHGREVAKVTNGFMKEIGIEKCESLGWGSPDLEDVASLADPNKRTSGWVDQLQSDEVKTRQRREAADRLDTALGPPIRRLRRRRWAAPAPFWAPGRMSYSLASRGRPEGIERIPPPMRPQSSLRTHSGPLLARNASGHVGRSTSLRTTGTPASPPTESLLLPPGALNTDANGGGVANSPMAQVTMPWRWMPTFAVAVAHNARSLESLPGREPHGVLGERDSGCREIVEETAATEAGGKVEKAQEDAGSRMENTMKSVGKVWFSHRRRIQK
eukprot:symbB.v1.2.007832.t1/scaffold463.1/size291460/13